MNPGVSHARTTGAFPAERNSATTFSVFSRRICSDSTISTSGTWTAGLKKCATSNCFGCRSAEQRVLGRNVDLLDEIIAAGFASSILRSTSS